MPKQIAIVYTQMASLQEDLKTLDEIHLGVRSDTWMGQPAVAAQRYSDMTSLIFCLLNLAVTHRVEGSAQSAGG